jgi:hypothetical protein
VSFNVFRCRNLALHCTRFFAYQFSQIAESQPDVSNCCKSHEGPPLSFTASDSEPKQIFRFPDARRRLSEHFGLKNQHLAADGFLPAIFAFFK